MSGSTLLVAECRCGAVRFEATGAPILTAICYCDDCQAGGRKIENLEAAAQVLEPDGGASYLTLRDDHWRCVKGQSQLTGVQLKERSPTTRYYARCCNTGMYLKYKRGHWVSTYRRAYRPGQMLPPVEMRTNLKFRNSDLPLPDGVPSFQRFPLRLFGKLIKARIDMALGR